MRSHASRIVLTASLTAVLGCGAAPTPPPTAGGEPGSGARATGSEAARAKAAGANRGPTATARVPATGRRAPRVKTLLPWVSAQPRNPQVRSLPAPVALAHHATCANPRCGVGSDHPARARRAPGIPITLWSNRLLHTGDAITLTNAGRPGDQIVGVVLSGAAQVSQRPPCPAAVVRPAATGPSLTLSCGDSLELRSWHAFRGPVGMRLTATQPNTLVAFTVVTSPAGAAGPGGAAAAEDRPKLVLRRGPPPPPARRAPPALLVEVIDAREVKPKVRPDGITLVSLFDLEPGRPALALLLAEPGTVVPIHSHADYLEAVAVTAGDGVLGLADRRGGRTLLPQDVHPGTIHIMPTSTLHNLVLGKHAPLLAIQVRVPTPQR